MSSPISEKQSRHRVLRIHGTFANRSNDRGDAWWQHGSEFAQRMEADCSVEIDETFHWSGANSETERRRAGRQLLARCRELEQDSTVDAYHLVGHSHGGSVIWHALKHAPDLKKLESVCTVGSPFFYTRPAFSGLAVVPALAAGTCFWLDQQRIQLFLQEYTFIKQRGDLISLWGLPALWLLLAIVLLVGLWVFVHFVVACFRVLRVRLAAAALWKRYGGRWFVLLSTQDEAVNALASLVDSASPPFLRSRAAGWRVWQRVVLAPVVSLLRLGDQFVWRVVHDSAVGSDVRGEVVRAVSSIPPGIRINAAMPDAIDASLIAEANDAAKESITQIRSTLGAALAEDVAPEHVLTTFANAIGPGILIHTSYFQSDSFNRQIGDWLRGRKQQPAQDAEPPVLRPSRTSEAGLNLLSSLAVVAVVAIAEINAQTLFDSRVYRQTYEFQIDELLKGASILEAIDEHRIAPLLSWVSTIRDMNGPQAAHEQEQRIWTRVRNNGDDGFLLAMTVADGSRQLKDLLPTHNQEVADVPWSTISAAVDHLAENDMADLAEEQILDFLDHTVYGSTADHGEVAEEMRPIHLNLLAEGAQSIEDVYAVAAELASQGDTSGADELRGKTDKFANEPYVMDFPDSDDFLDKVSELSREMVFTAAATRGSGDADLISDSVDFAHSNSISGLDEWITTRDAHLLDKVTGLLSRGDWDDVAHELTQSDPEADYVLVEAVGRYLVHTPPQFISEHRTLHENLASAAAGCTGKERIAALKIMLRCHSPDSDVTDEVLQLLADGQFDQGETEAIRGHVLERLAGEGRIDQAVDRMEEWFAADREKVSPHLPTIRYAVEIGQPDLAVRLLLVASEVKMPGPLNEDDLFHISTGLTTVSRKYSDAWQGNPAGLDAADLEFMIVREAHKFTRIDVMLLAIDQVETLTARARLLASLAESLESKPLESFAIWQRLEVFLAANQLQTVEQSLLGRAAVGYAKVEKFDAAAQLLEQISPVDRLSASCRILAHYDRLRRQHRNNAGP